MRRNTYDKNIRKIAKLGNSYALTLPIDLVRELGWKKTQKVTITKRGQGLLIQDWEK